jgi:hypothetical protein
MLPHKERLRLIKFVCEYENPAGGFNFPRETPASIAETYNGVMLFNELGFDCGNPLTKEYIRNLELKADMSLEHLYRLAKVSETLSMPDRMSEIRESVLGRKCRKGSKLTDAYYSVLLEEVLDIDGVLRQDMLEYVLKSKVKKLRFMSECQKYLAVKTHLGLEVETEEAVSWVQATQSYDGGFGFLPGSTSFLENVYSALDSLQMLNSVPLDTQGCEDFVLACRSKEGAFGRQLMALPSLEHSLLAVRSLKIINAMRIRAHSDRD